MKTMMTVTSAALAALSAFAIDPRVPPLFTGNVMTNETVLFMGTDDAAPLMYQAEEILSVRSFDLETEYEEGVDWTFDRNTHTIRPTANTRMPYYTEAEWYPTNGTFTCNLDGKAYVFFSEGSVISLHQVCVTYRHADAWNGPAPRNDAAAFAPMLSDFASRIGGKTLFYGDSITTAANSSGKIGFAPYIPGWPSQVHDAIVAATGNSGIKYVNTAVGGKNTQWGLDNVQERVISYAPDFVLIAFGMNDSMTAANYSAKTEATVNAIHAALPNATVMLVPPMVPNPEATNYASRGALFAEYEQALFALAEKFRAAGFARIGCANVNTMHAAVLARKRFRDMTGNNINHCNDFSARIYRDTILAAMGLTPGSDTAEQWTPRAGTVMTWFNGGVAAGWPLASSKFGGTWRNPQDGEFSSGVLSGKNLQTILMFDADQAVGTTETNVTVSLQMEFQPLTEPPPVPTEAAAGVTSVWEGSATNYWVLAKGFGGANIWKRVPGSRAKAGVAVSVSIELARDGSKVRACYQMDDAKSEWLELACNGIVHGVGVRGNLHALHGEYEDLTFRGFLIKLARLVSNRK